MRYILKNESVKAAIESKGAELVSLKDDAGREYLWSGDEKYWGRHSPVLFPFVGRLKGLKYSYEGKEYTAAQHGFARDMEFDVVSQKEDEITFEVRDDETTFQVYPFHFSLRIGYHLCENGVKVTWKVTNLDEKKEMHFSIGAHPGFVCPFEEGEDKNGYKIGLDVSDRAEYYFANYDTGLLIEKKHELKLQDGKFVIDEGFFDESAYVFEDHQIKEVSLIRPGGKKYVTVKFDMPIVAIWSQERTNAPFICIEPWCGRCDVEGFSGTLEERAWGNKLSAGESFDKEYVIEIHP